MTDDTHCRGCENDFYNGRNDFGVKKCWSLKDAKLVTRFRTGYWTAPTEKGAFEKVKVLNCRHEKGYVLCAGLPDFVKPSDVRGQ